MTDRELLELAAKAVGMIIDKSLFNGGGTSNTGFDVMGNAMLDWHNGVCWNPLTDDGDALRLAVKLRLLILPCKSGEIVTVDSYSTNDESTENARHNPCAATRRAIVRAAAEIGKAA